MGILVILSPKEAEYHTMTSLLLGDAVDRYLNFVRSAYTKGTYQASEQSLRLFLSVVGNVQMRTLAPRHAERFQSHMLQHGQKPNTVNTRMSRLSAFTKWAVSNRYMSASITGTTRAVPVPAKPRLRVPVTDFPRLLDAAERPDHRIVVALGLFLFLRASEVSSLRVRDVDLDQGVISVTIQKTNDWDEMPICWELDQELRRWLTEYARDIGRPLHGDDFLVPAHKSFPGWHPRPESGTFNPTRRLDRPFNHVQRVLQKAGYPVTEGGKRKGEGCHTLRRSGARFYFDGLVEGRYGDKSARDDALRIVMAALHHKSASTTERYLGLEGDRMKRDRSIKGVRLLPDLTENVIQIKEAK